MRRAGVKLAVIACMCLPATARAGPAVSLNARLTPERLGHSSAVSFGFQVTERDGRVPPALTEFELQYPSNLGVGTSGLGMAMCAPTTIEALGVDACPADSLMGYGTVLTEIPAAPTPLREDGDLTIVRGPDEAGHLSFLIHATGLSPIITELTFPAMLLPASAPYGDLLMAHIPLTPSFPGAPDVAVVSMHATLGPPGLIYNERVGNRVLTYHPAGILLPNRCPRGGFPFATKLGFQDGSHALARTTVRCPRAATK